MLRDCTLPLLSGPCFRPWSREKRKIRKKDEDELAGERYNARKESFNLHELLAEASEIERLCRANQSNGKFISLTIPCKGLGTTNQGKALSGNEQKHDHMCEDTNQMWQSVEAGTHTEKLFLSEKCLRKKLISYYNNGYLIEPYEAVVGESLSHKKHSMEVNFVPAFPPVKQEIFPFAVPHYRLPLLPSTRKELLRISEVLTKCKVLPMQLQDMRLVCKREQNSETIEIACAMKANNKDILHERSHKTSLRVFIPASG